MNLRFTRPLLVLWFFASAHAATTVVAHVGACHVEKAGESRYWCEIALTNTNKSTEISFEVEAYRQNDARVEGYPRTMRLGPIEKTVLKFEPGEADRSFELYSCLITHTVKGKTANVDVEGTLHHLKGNDLYTLSRLASFNAGRRKIREIGALPQRAISIYIANQSALAAYGTICLNPIAQSSGSLLLDVVVGTNYACASVGGFLVDPHAAVLLPTGDSHSVFLKVEGPKGTSGLYLTPVVVTAGEHQTYMSESSVKFSQVQ